MTDSHKSRPSLDKSNPYAPTMIEPIEESTAKRIRVMPVEIPPGNSECSYFSFGVFAIVALLALAFAPQWIYTDRRAGFAYRLASTSRSIVLRACFIVLATPFAFLLVLSLLP